MSSVENEAVVRSILESMYRNPEILSQHPGLYQTARVTPYTLAAFPDMTCTVTKQFSSGDMVATLALLTGTHRGEFFGAAPTGKQVSLQVVSMDRVVDGKVTEHNATANWIKVLVEIGAVAPPPWMGAK